MDNSHKDVQFTAVDPAFDKDERSMQQILDDLSTTLGIPPEGDKPEIPLEGYTPPNYHPAAAWMNDNGEILPATRFGCGKPSRRSGWADATPLYKAPQWIPVGQGWPEFHETVLLNCDGELHSTGFLRQNGGGVGIWAIDAEHPSDGSRWIVTHWMPLPSGPEEKGKNG